MAKFYVYSTLAAGVMYTNYAPGAHVPTAVAEVFIAGGAGVADKYLVTPLGVVTEVTAEQLAHLEANSVFQMHTKNGFIKVEESKRDVGVAVSDMQARDESAPAIDEDFTEVAPVKGKGK